MRMSNEACLAAVMEGLASKPKRPGERFKRNLLPFLMYLEYLSRYADAPLSNL
jgi:hypothetical protein